MNSKAFTKLSFLVTDDATNMRRTVKNMLRSFGAQSITEADDGDTAWEKINAKNIQFFICNWHMPRLPGVELLRHVRGDQRYRDIPFLMVTSEVSESRIAQAAETEVDGYLLKPFIPKILEEKLIQIMEKKAEPSPFDAHMKNGLLHLDKGSFESALEAKPDSTRARQNIGKVYLKMGSKSDAENWFLEAVRANPQYIKAHETLGEFYINEGKENNATTYLESAAQISPHNPDRQKKLGKIYLENGVGERPH